MSTHAIQQFPCCRHLKAFAQEPQNSTIVKTSRVALAIFLAIFAVAADLLLYPVLKIPEWVRTRCDMLMPYTSAPPPRRREDSVPPVFLVPITSSDIGFQIPGGTEYIQESLETATFASNDVYEAFDRIGPAFADSDARLFAARMTLLHFLESDSKIAPQFINMDTPPMWFGKPAAPPLRFLCNHVPKYNFAIYREATVVPDAFDALPRDAQIFYRHLDQHAQALANDLAFMEAFANLRPSFQA